MIFFANEVDGQNQRDQQYPEVFFRYIVSVVHFQSKLNVYSPPVYSDFEP